MRRRGRSRSPGEEPKGVSLGRDGALLIQTSLGSLRDTPPVAFQRVDGRLHDVPVRFTLRGESAGTTQVGFAVGRGYDPTKALVIDPGIVYAALISGIRLDTPWDIALGPDGSVYVTGTTYSSDFPVTPGAYSGASRAYSSAFVTNIDPTGSRVVYSTILGGNAWDDGTSIAVGADGSAYVTGYTVSDDFPTTPGAVQRHVGPEGQLNGFLVKLDPSGSRFEYSTLLGGGVDDYAHEVAVDAHGNAYVLGHSFSHDFPITAGALQSSFDAQGDANSLFVTKVDPSGSGLAYSTFLIGSDSLPRGHRCRSSTGTSTPVDPELANAPAPGGIVRG